MTTGHKSRQPKDGERKLQAADGAPGPLDPIGPHDAALPLGGAVESGGTEGTVALNLDDEEIYSGRDRTRDGGTIQSSGGDSGQVGPPSEQLSCNNGLSDPVTGKGTA